MSLRLKSELYVQALVRRVHATLNGVMAAVYIAKRGDADAGGIYLRVNRLDGTAGVLTMFTNMDGVRVWRVIAEPGTPEPDVEALLARETTRDPDIWVVDIEDADGRHFLNEPIEGDWP